MQFGVNTWIWVAPLNDADLEWLIPHLAKGGADMVELSIEGLNDYDYAKAGKLIKEHGLGVDVVAAMGPDRDLIHTEKSIRDNGVAYVRHCIEAVHTLGGQILAGPLYSAVGRTWQMTAEERARDTDLLVSQLKALAEHAADHGVTMCVEPLNRSI